MEQSLGKELKLNMKIYCCEEHIELALDVLVDETELPPQMELLKEDEKLSTNCEYCRKEAVYLVANEYSDTK